MQKIQKQRLVAFTAREGGDSGLGNTFDMFIALFNEIPKETYVMTLTNAQSRKYYHKMVEQFKMEVITDVYDKLTFAKNELRFSIAMDNKNKVLIRHQDYRTAHLVVGHGTKQDVIDELLNKTKGYYTVKKKRTRRKARIHILTLVGTGMKERLTFMPFSLDKFEMSIDKNYNDDFQEVSEHILTSLNVKDGKGIAILHGLAGTGKTFYLKHLCKSLKKKILYIPPALVQYIVSPFFMKMLGNHKNSVLVIEDADNVLRKRDEHSNIQDVSSILNLTDGMLSDVLRLQVVATFNTKLSNIDDAFLRKGRLIAEYEFKELTQEKAQSLSDHLGFDAKIKDAITLSDVYNQESPLLKSDPNDKRVGYK